MPNTSHFSHKKYPILTLLTDTWRVLNKISFHLSSSCRSRCCPTATGETKKQTVKLLASRVMEQKQTWNCCMCHQNKQTAESGQMPFEFGRNPPLTNPCRWLKLIGIAFAPLTLLDGVLQNNRLNASKQLSFHCDCCYRYKWKGLSVFPKQMLGSFKYFWDSLFPVLDLCLWETMMMNY